MRYWAFISYAHADEKAATALHRALETYKGHRRLPPTSTPTGEPIPPRIAPVFRDRDELGASGNLPERLQEALKASRFLIVVCSPAAARSPWVNAEIQRFKALGRSDRILAYIVDGEPWASRTGTMDNESFPEALRYLVSSDGTITDVLAEPLAADARPHADGPRNARLKIISGMLGVGFDDLRRRDEARRRQQWWIVTTLTLAGLAVLATVLTYASGQRRLANLQGIVSRATDAIGRNEFDRAILLAVAAAGAGDTPELRRLVQTLLTVEPGLTRYLSLGSGNVTAVALDATGRYAAASTREGTLGVFDLQTGKMLGALRRGNGEEIAFVCFAGGQHDHVVGITTGDRMLDWPDGTTMRETKITDESLSNAACPSDRPVLRVLTANKDVVEVDVAAREPSSRVLMHVPVGSGDESVFSRDGKHVVTLNGDAFTINVTDLEGRSTGQVKLSGSKVPVNQFRANRDASLLFVMDAGSPQIRMYRTATGSTAPFTLQPPGAVLDLDFNADGSLFAFSMLNGVVGVGGTEALSLRRQLSAASVFGHAGGAVALDAAGHVLVVGAHDGRVLQWDADPPRATPAEITTQQPLDDALRRLCAIANRNLSEAEIRELLDGQAPTRTCPSS
jgi:TIR domain-containing protein